MAIINRNHRHTQVGASEMANPNPKTNPNPNPNAGGRLGDGKARQDCLQRDGQLAKRHGVVRACDRAEGLLARWQAVGELDGGGVLSARLLLASGRHRAKWPHVHSAGAPGAVLPEAEEGGREW